MRTLERDSKNLTEALMAGKRALPPDDFPLMVDGKTIKSKAGRMIATTESEAAAVQIAEWLNEYQSKREEDRWSA
jgi:chaperone required for assembly of F1-ATPase